jgi:hypothetical protein
MLSSVAANVSFKLRKTNTLRQSGDNLRTLRSRMHPKASSLFPPKSMAPGW